MSSDKRAIEVEEVFPHAPEILWRALTTGALIGRWMMAPAGFEPVEGNRFTFQTTPEGPWDGTINCQVLEVVPNQRFAYAWRGGHRDNAGYGSLLDTVVTFTLTPEAQGTRLRVVHSGFELPRNVVGFEKLGDGWRQVMRRLATIAAEQ